MNGSLFHNIQGLQSSIIGHDHIIFNTNSCLLTEGGLCYSWLSMEPRIFIPNMSNKIAFLGSVRACGSYCQ